MKARVALVIAVALALAAPAGALAAEAQPLLPPLPPRHLLSQVGAPVPPPRSFRSGFVTKERGGLRVGVETFGSAVILVVFHGRHHHLAETAYLARGVARPERLQARFGRFGKVRMRFHEAPKRPWRGRPRDCHGSQRFVKRRGVFAGDFEFKGEDGYVSLHLHRIKGAIVTVAAKCLHRRSGPSAHASLFVESVTALFASARDGVSSDELLALTQRGKAVYFALSQESRGRLAILRAAFARGHGSIPVNEAVTAAHISPPAPFHGTGRYLAKPDGTSTWSGNLSANFPGDPRHPLTGPQFEALLEVPF
jgi:hypothetical protein